MSVLYAVGDAVSPVSDFHPLSNIVDHYSGCYLYDSNGNRWSLAETETYEKLGLDYRCNHYFIQTVIEIGTVDTLRKIVIDHGHCMVESMC